MRVTLLFLRTRRTGYTLVVLAGIGVLAWFYPALYRGTTLRLDHQIMIPVLFFMPLLAGTTIAMSTGSPFGELERTTSRSLPALRLAQLLGLLFVALGSLFLALAATKWAQGSDVLVLLRNLGGFAGLSFLGAVCLGNRLAWIVPFTFGLIAYRLGGPNLNELHWWAWPLQPPGDGLAAALALGLLLGGLVAITLRGSNDELWPWLASR